MRPVHYLHALLGSCERTILNGPTTQGAQGATAGWQGWRGGGMESEAANQGWAVACSVGRRVVEEARISVMQQQLRLISHCCEAHPCRCSGSGSHRRSAAQPLGPWQGALTPCAAHRWHSGSSAAGGLPLPGSRSALVCTIAGAAQLPHAAPLQPRFPWGSARTCPLRPPSNLPFAASFCRAPACAHACCLPKSAASSGGPLRKPRLAGPLPPPAACHEAQARGAGAGALCTPAQVPGGHLQHSERIHQAVSGV